MAKHYKHYCDWDVHELYPRGDDFEQEFEDEEALTADDDMPPFELPPLIETKELNQTEKKLWKWSQQLKGYAKKATNEEK